MVLAGEVAKEVMAGVFVPGMLAGKSMQAKDKDAFLHTKTSTHKIVETPKFCLRRSQSGRIRYLRQGLHFVVLRIGNGEDSE